MKALGTVAAVLLFASPLRAGGEKPAWVDGKDQNWAADVYLTAVGFGPDRAAAENSALANVAKVFEASIQSVSKDYMAAFSDGEKAIEVQSSETLTKVATSKTLSGVKISETWDSGSDMVYCLATLERKPAARAAQERIAHLDAEIEKKLVAARGTDDKVKQLTSLRHAAKSMQERMAKNAELRILALDGKGVAAKHSPADIVALLDATTDSFQIAVAAEGEVADDLADALTQGLNETGLAVRAIEDEEESAFDLIVRARCRVENASVRNARFNLSRVVVAVELFNPGKNKVIKSFSESRKEGAGSQDEAARRAVRKMQKKLVKKIGRVIESKFGPR